MTGPGSERGDGVEVAALPPVALLAVALGLAPACSAHRPTDAANGFVEDECEIEPAPQSGWRGEFWSGLSGTGSWP